MQQERTSDLCSACAAITVPALGCEEGYAHLSDARDLPKSAQTCILCRLILLNILQKPDTTHINPPKPHPDIASALDDLGLPAEAEIALRLKWRNGFLDYFLTVGQDENEEPKWLQIGRDSPRIFRISANSQGEIDERVGKSTDIPGGAIVSAAPDLSYIAMQTQQWLKECIESHADCRSAVVDQEQPLPTRVLDVGAIGSPVVHLRHATGQKGRYAALSYCWGKSIHLQTKKLTISSHLNGIPMQALPATCRDAVLVTRSLGLLYLWIDSLCIVQDDAEDWRREAAKMGHVYGNAYITIAATRAIESASGFLGPRLDDAVALLSPAGAEPFYIGCRHSFARDIDRAPLARRAWALQERVLSRRTLHFTSTQVYWECWTCHQGEDLDDRYLGVFKKDTYPTCFAPTATTQSKQDQNAAVPRQWWYLLTSYTECGLSYQKDKLVAIGGLVDRISQQTGQRAIAGHFEDTLHAGLLWSVCDVPLQKQTEVKVPSWSWASRKGRINHVQLYDWAANNEINLTNPCTDSDAKLTAVLRKLRANITYGELESSDEYRNFPPELDYHVVNFRFVSPDWLDSEDDLGWLTLDADDRSTPAWEDLGWAVVACNINTTDDSNNDEESQSATVDASALPANTTEGPFYCLLVQLVAGGLYERVGIGAVKDREWFDDTKKQITII